MMLSSVTWAEASGVSAAPSNHGMDESNQTGSDSGVSAADRPCSFSEMAMRQLLGKPLESGRTYVKEGDHEDQGVPRSIAGGKSEMDKWLRDNADEVQAWDDVSGKELDAEKVWEARKLELELFRNMGG